MWRNPLTTDLEVIEIFLFSSSLIHPFVDDVVFLLFLFWGNQVRKRVNQMMHRKQGELFYPALHVNSCFSPPREFWWHHQEKEELIHLTLSPSFFCLLECFCDSWFSSFCRSFLSCRRKRGRRMMIREFSLVLVFIFSFCYLPSLFTLFLLLVLWLSFACKRRKSLSWGSSFLDKRLSSAWRWCDDSSCNS